MGRRLIVDTNILIGIAKGSVTATKLLCDDDDIAIAAVTKAELLTGVLIDRDAVRRGQRRNQTEVILAGAQILTYTERTASLHASLMAHTRQIGMPLGAHDLIIAAHAVEQDRAIATLDARARFGDLPGVRAIEP